MAQIAPIYLSTTIITRLKDNQEKGTATGFFYVDRSDNLFLITNKHVIYGEKYAENPSEEINKFKLNLHTDQNDALKNEIVEIPLFDKKNKLWLQHQHNNVDVVVLPINIDRDLFVKENKPWLDLRRYNSDICPLIININGNKYIIGPVNEDFLNEDLIIDFETIFIMGYPHGWYDRVHNLPITAVGHLSSAFRVDLNAEPVILGQLSTAFGADPDEESLILGDVVAHPGMSGSPVFISLIHHIDYRNNYRAGTKKTILVGIFSGKPRIYNRNDKEVKNHSFIKIWNYRLIQEILSSSSYSQFKQKS